MSQYRADKFFQDKLNDVMCGVSPKVFDVWRAHGMYSILCPLRKIDHDAYDTILKAINLHEDDAAQMLAEAIEILESPPVGKSDTIYDRIKAARERRGS